MKSLFSCFLLVLLTTVTLPAQSSIRGDGRQAVEHTGIALVKPQKWSKPNEAVPVRFTAYTNRGGYFVLRSPSGQERQVWVEQIVGGKPILDPEIPPQILSPADRNALQEQIDALKQIVAKVPAAAVDISQLVKPLVEAVKRYDGGEVRIEGYWKPVAEHKATEFYKAQQQLRQSIKEYPDKTQFDLEENSNFKQLVELSKGIPALQAKVDGIRADLEKQVLDQKQADALNRLSNSNTSDEDAQSLLTELKAFKNPTEKTTQVLQQAETAAYLSAEINKLSQAVEAHFASPVPQGETPRLPADLAFQGELLNKQIADFRKSSPPATVRIPEENARALVQLCRDLPKVAPLFDDRNYLEAAAVLTRIVQHSAKIGHSTESACESLFKAAAYKVVVYEKLVAQGEEAEKNGKFVAAKTFFIDALKICNNPILENRVKELIGKNPL
jgi:hypothetical protein